MNGVHDMGGMEGLGPIEPEENEPVFHEPWEGRVLAMNIAVGAWGKWNIDAGRHSRELIPGAIYLQSGYYEKWILGLGELMVKSGLLTREELEGGTPIAGKEKAEPPFTAEKVGPALIKGRSTARDVSLPAEFRPGQSVRAKNIHVSGHTRLPRYARGRQGVIHRDHGVHVFPDSNAHFQGEQPHHLYSVRFAARELWGEAAPGTGAVYLDLWEAYLEPV